MKLSILMPVYNERTVVERSLARSSRRPCRKTWTGN